MTITVLVEAGAASWQQGKINHLAYTSVPPVGRPATVCTNGILCDPTITFTPLD